MSSSSNRAQPFHTTYDADGRLASIADQSRTYLSNLQYQGKGNSLNSLTYGNTTTQTVTLNDRLQMTGQELKRGTETLQKYAYNYGELDAGGILKNNGKLEQIESYIGTDKQWTQKFKYDAIGRLKEAEEKRGDTSALSYKQVFDYDRFGNLYRKNSSNPTAGQATPLAFTPIEDADIDKATNRFTSATSTTYDEAGQVTADNKFRLMSFGYDANGRTVKASRANVPDALSVYDAGGQRVAEKVNDVWRFLIYDIGGKLVAEYGGLSSNDDGGVKYVFQDWQGSTRCVVNHSGYVLSRMDYQAFGEEIGAGTGLRTAGQGFASNSLRQRYGLTERDDATGLDHTWFRKNENKAGRWTSPDPYNGSMSLSNPQSFNRYSYVENQPTNFIDPSGLQLLIICYGTETWNPVTATLTWTGYCEIKSFGGGAGTQYVDNSTNQTIAIGGGGGSGVDRILTNVKNKDKTLRDEFIKNCLKGIVEDRASTTDKDRQEDIDSSMLWSLSGTNAGDFLPKSVKRNKNLGAAAAVLGILVNVGQSLGSVYIESIKQGVKSVDHKEDIKKAKEVTQNDKDACRQRATDAGY